MNTLVCKNCGSSSFIEEAYAYVCQHCGTKIVKTNTTVGNKRFKVIGVSVVLVLIVAVMVYMKVSKVEKTLEHMVPESSQSHVERDERISDQSAGKVFEMEGDEGVLEHLLKEYGQQPESKALFISLDKKGKYAYGYVFGKGSTKEATKQAFLSCEKERKRRGLKPICTPYLVNDHVSPTLVK